MHVDHRIREVAHAPTVIEVHMSQDDVTHVLRLEAEGSDLRRSRLLRIQRHDRNEPKEAQDARRIDGILLPQPGIYQRQPAIGLDQQTQRAGAQMEGRACVAGKAVQEMNRHDAPSMALRCVCRLSILAHSCLWSNWRY